MANFNDFLALFDNPAVSVFDRSKRSDTSLRLGEFRALYWDLLNFGNSAKGISGHSMRLAPLLAPTFTDLRLQEHSAVVPLRVIMEDYENVFNYAKNKTGASLPHFTLRQLAIIYQAMLQQGISPIGSLFDDLGYPVFGDLWKSALPRFSNWTWSLFGVSGYAYDIPPFNDVSGNYLTDISFSGSWSFRDSSYSSGNLLPFFAFVIESSGFNDINAYYTLLDFKYSKDIMLIPSVEEFIKPSVFTTVQSAVDAYQNYLFSDVIRSYVLTLEGIDSNDVVYTSLPLRAYWRVHYDWNVNGNFVDRDAFMSDIYNFEDRLFRASVDITSDQGTPEQEEFIRKYTRPASRLWDNDFWTTLLPTSSSDDAITIPANATVLDMAKLTSFQKFVLKLSYSSRYRDVVWNLFKIKPSDARLQQSSIIMQKTHNVGIGEVLQTSESTPSSVQGTFTGRGYSSGRSKGYHIFCEEPCVLLNYVSFVPRASYADALHPLIHVSDILDFPIPDMDVLGNQPIMSDLVTGNPADSNTVIGYGRQYEEWLYQYNTVHGDFKTTLDYWQLTRRFDDTAVINDDFLRMHPADDFDQIFSVPGASHAFLSIYYDAKVSRHVHRNVRIQI